LHGKPRKFCIEQLKKYREVINMFIRAANPIWYMVDLNGLGLNDQYYISFLTNTFPYLPQSIFQDVNGTIPWPNPLQFYPNGTLPDNMYFDDSEVYRLEVRQGPTQSDPLIYEINNVIAGQGGITPNNLELATAGNQSTNPQFAEVYFTTPLTLTMAGTYRIAPGWQLILTGTGTTTLTQLILSGNQNIVGNPPFALKINNSGWTTAILQQTFNNNGAIWANGAIAGLIVARAEITNETVTMNYVPSDAGTPVVIFSASLTTGNYAQFDGAVDIVPSTDTDLSSVAFVNIQLVLPPTGIVDITNIQITGQSLPLPSSFDPATDLPAFQQETVERNIDHQFHIFKPQLSYKPIPSYLIGWDFPLNPAQLGSSIGPLATGANTSFYAWDQTIIFQSVNSGIAVSRGPSGNIQLAASVATQIALIQYLPQIQARKILNDKIAVNIAANATSNILCTVSLWYTKGSVLPSTVGSNNSIVATLDSNGKPATFNQPTGGTWIEVPPLNGQEQTFTLSASSNNNFTDFNFNGWDMKGVADTGLATYFAIVVGTATIPLAAEIYIDSISLCEGDIATRPAPQSYDEVLRQCQFYYEQSYVPGTVPGSLTNVGLMLNLQNVYINGGNIAIVPGAFELQFKTVKNTIPVLSFYSPANGAANSVQVTLFNGGSVISTANPAFSSNWTLIGSSSSVYNATYLPGSFTNLVNPAATATAPQSVMAYQYVADSRLGI
jgi:hypothetical protein